MQEAITFNWKPEELFELKGQELELMLNYCNSVLNNVEAQRIIAVYEIKKALDEKITQGVADGKVNVVKSPS